MENLDFLSVYTIGYHSPSSEPDSAMHHAPLLKPAWDTSNGYADFAVKSWIAKGVSPNKIVLGIPLFGYTWKLSPTNNFDPPVSALGPGVSGVAGEKGILAYYDICYAVLTAGWKVFPDPSGVMGPYAVSPSNPRTWVGYDDPAMAITKTQYVRNNSLGGVMVWDLSYDDFRDTCGKGANPITNAISDTLKGLNNDTVIGFCECICD